MNLPPNVVRTPTLPWEADGAPLPFGSECREVRDALALRDLGLHLERLEPGRRSCPLHDHLLEEEVFYVLDGELTVLERTPDGHRRRYSLRAGELVCYPPGTRIAHAFHNASAAPVTFLAMSDRRPGDVCTYPDSGKTLLRGGHGIGVWHGRDEASPAPEALAAARARAAAEPVEDLADDARPAHVITTATALERALGDGDRRFHGTQLSRPAGATAVFVHRDRLPPGCHPSPLHAHAHNEELLLLLTGTLTLTQRDAAGETTTTALAPGDLVHWPPGGPAHRVDNPGPDDAVYLVVGTDRRWDIVDFPDRGTRYVALLDAVGHLTPTDYWDGELA